MAKVWKIQIPVRPKAVQSVRGGNGRFFADRKVRAWKDSIRPYIKTACDGRPTSVPLQINRIVYTFALPKSASRRVRRYVEAGGKVPYIGTADITDNLAKGLVDTCAGLVFENDKLIWKTCSVEKLYGVSDSIYIEFEETPDVLMVDGRMADGSVPDRSSLF